MYVTVTVVLVQHVDRQTDRQTHTHGEVGTINMCVHAYMSKSAAGMH